MNNSSLSVKQNAAWVNVTFATVYSVVVIVGLPLNGLYLWILPKRHGLKTSNTVFMFNLALSDFALVLSLPMRIYYHATAMWPFGAVVCATSTALFRLNMFTSAFFITFISVDRLLAVVFPLRSRVLRTPRSSGIICAITWLLLISHRIATAIKRFSDDHSVRPTGCFEAKLSDRLATTVTPLLMLTLLLVNVVSTIMVMRTLHRRQTASDQHHNSIMLVFLMNLLMFAIFFVPLGIVIILKSVDEITDLTVLQGTTCYATLNCCIDPFIYYFGLKAFGKKGDAYTTHLGQCKSSQKARNETMDVSCEL